MKRIFLLIGVPIFLIAAYFIADSILFDGFKPKRINEDGFQGEIFAKAEAKNQTTVIVLGGGDWAHYWGDQFVKQGHVALSLPFLGVSGNPNLPEVYPLEYFEKAISWLGKKPEVNANKILIMGASRNAELALLLASVYPNLIHGVIAYAPGSVVWSNTVLPYSSDEILPSYTLNGNPIPFIKMEKIKGGDESIINTIEYWKKGLESQDSSRTAEIQVEKVNGPILLISGKSDEVWPSSEMANQIETRAKSNGFNFNIQNLQYENAGHLISSNPDSESDTDQRTGEIRLGEKEYEYSFGGTQVGDNAAKVDAKQKVIDFINKL
ncbi:MAG: acyl-CoA thioester hydrolase/BAAT C-terminal domain-containing protein [Bacteroidia bacterium]